MEKLRDPYGKTTAGDSDALREQWSWYNAADKYTKDLALVKRNTAGQCTPEGSAYPESVCWGDRPY